MSRNAAIFRTYHRPAYPSVIVSIFTEITPLSLKYSFSSEITENIIKPANFERFAVNYIILELTWNSYPESLISLHYPKVFYFFVFVSFPLYNILNLQKNSLHCAVFILKKTAIY